MGGMDLDAMLERHVIVTEALIRAIHDGFGETSNGFREISEAVRDGFAQLQAEIADQREQIQANTQAILRVLDRFPPGPQSA